ncbi:MAG: ISC system 2Fe-2S type ferredoxin [Burkholderiales bacterium]|jgi:2Fe-2S ferredoxin|nr:ISC system 2Fe-2S type ferredoxin [Burkholderiales bacterium]
MPTITVLPHPEWCKEGVSFEASPGESLLDALLTHGVHVEHACEKSCACTTCHVIVRKGVDSLNETSEKEEDMLDRAWGLTTTSRLSCQTKIGAESLEIELPRYTINHAKER